MLQLPAVREEDAGRYSCQVTTAAGQDLLHYDLEVLSEYGLGQGGDGGTWQLHNHLLPAAPAIHGGTEDPAEEVAATINGSAHFKCAATGHPVPTVSWLRNHIPIVADSRHQLLEGGTVLQVGAALGRVVVPEGTHEARGHSCLPKETTTLVLPGTEAPVGAPAALWLGTALSGALLPCCRWSWWRKGTLAATPAWLRTQLAQLRSTLPSLCRVRHPRGLFPGSLTYPPAPPLPPPPPPLPAAVPCGFLCPLVHATLSPWRRRRCQHALAVCFLLETVWSPC